jgi:hypothetical protein
MSYVISHLEDRLRTELDNIEYNKKELRRAQEKEKRAHEFTEGLRERIEQSEQAVLEIRRALVTLREGGVDDER